MSEQNTSNEVLIEGIDPTASIEYIRNFLAAKQNELAALPADANVVDRARLNLDIAEAMVGVNRADEAWEIARNALDVFIENESWQEAVNCCDVLYQSSQPAALIALAHGIWLAVTYPIDPQLSINMLNYLIDETPDKADGAAVAAITAHYIADLRTEDKQRENLLFLTNQMLAAVARGHSGVEDQETLSAWMDRLRLKDPQDFLPKLSLVLGAIVPPDQWWFDRDALRDKLPD
jgi:hypothetical protein